MAGKALRGRSALGAGGFEFTLHAGESASGEHVFAVCLACALSDAILIAVGVAGFGAAAAVMWALAAKLVLDAG